MANKKQAIDIKNVQFKTAHNAHIPYAYVDPKTNFLNGPNKWGEAGYVDAFIDGFSVGRNDPEKELDHIISSLETKESHFLNLLNEKQLLISSDDGWYKINIEKLSNIEQQSPPIELLHNLENELIKFDNQAISDEKIEEALENQLNEQIISTAQAKLPKALQAYFNNNMRDLPSWTTPNELFNQIAPKYQTMISQNEEVPTPILKLITNIIAWYELPENRKKQGTSKHSLYNKLKAYRTAINKSRKGKRSSIRQASADLQTKNNKLSLQQMLNKMEQSIQGQAKQQLGNLVEKKLYKTFLQQGFDKNTAHLTGQLTVSLKYPLPDLTINSLESTTGELTDEFSTETFLKTLNKNRNNLRSPKADIALEDFGNSYGISVKSTSLKSIQDMPHKIALHHGTYISLIRFLMRYTGGMELANQLANPQQMHAILNLVRASGEINSPSLNTAASNLAYAFIGANEGNIFTEYGQIIQEGYDQTVKSTNNVVALIDSAGNMRLVSSLLREIKENLNKASIEISFKAGKFSYITKNGNLHPYTRNIVFSENFARPQDFSSIDVLVYMFSS